MKSFMSMIGTCVIMVGIHACGCDGSNDTTPVEDIAASEEVNNTVTEEDGVAGADAEQVGIKALGDAAEAIKEAVDGAAPAADTEENPETTENTETTPSPEDTPSEEETPEEETNL